MDENAKKQLDRRLARIEGQVRGLRRLVEEDAYCIDVLNQIAAVTSALNQTAAAIASGHIRHCITGTESAHSHAKSMSTEELHEELDEVLRRLAR
ncbi:MAG: metal-sensitive transcriptional regulator [Fimbriimonadaceae bacterium]|nr:metal-sensitive transcriptional regulator [Fimbriimonadaceae bacterium]